MRRCKRWLGASLAFLVVLVASGLGGGGLLLRASLPRSTGTLALHGLAQEVAVERDALGVVTIRARSRRDAVRALGFVHAQERYFQMDLLRRSAAGELAALLGSAALPRDRLVRVHRMRARLKQAHAQLPAAQRSLIDAYRDGVNAGLRDLAARPFEYFLLRATPLAWQDEDSLLVAAAMAFSLNDAENRRELALSRMHAALPGSAFDFLTASGGAWDAPLLGTSMDWPAPPGTAELDLRSHASRDAGAGSAQRTDVPGSNSFAVGGALTGGGALVANDMHLELRVPGTWFRTRLIYPDPHEATRTLDVTGASLPGAPAIVVGSNGDIAWGYTNSYIDSTDWVRVQRNPQDPARYRAARGWQAIEQHIETIAVAHGAPERLVVEDTQWGPVTASDVDGTPLALAWTIQQPGGIDLGIGRMETARTIEAALDIAHDSGIPVQNLLVGDRSGHIAWSLAGRIPRRSGDYDPRLPADWSLADSGWQGWLAADAYPVLADPASARLWTANQRVVDAAGLAVVGDGGYDLGARAAQIRDDLTNGDHFTPADMLAIQLDDRALLLERWKALLERTLDSAPDSPLHATMREALHDWRGHAAIDSVAYRLVREWRDEVIDEVLDGFAAVVRVRFPDFTLPKLPQAEHAVWLLLEQRPLHLLSGHYASWDALLLASADRVASALAAQPGGLAKRTWGERNTAQINHPLSRSLPALLARRLDMPHEPLPGDSNMPRVQGPSFGASERFAVTPGREEEGYFMMPGGQGGHPLSPWFGAGHADWAAGRPTPFLPGPAQRVLNLVP